LPLALLGLLALIGALIQWRAARSIPSDRFGMQVSSRFGAPMFSLILIIVIGFLILLGLTWSLYGLVVAVILLLASASQNAWFLLMLERS
jgi:amino acid transporter